MGLVSIGDLSQSLMLRHQNAATKAELQRLTGMLTSGRVADVTAHLGGNLAPLAGLDASMTRLQGYAEVTAEAARHGSVLQTVFGMIDSTANQLSSGLLTAGQGGSPALVTGAALQAKQALEQVVGVMNTRVADRSVLSGVATDLPALVDADTLLAQAGAVVAGAVGVSGVEKALQDWLDDPSGYAVQSYRGGDARPPVDIAEGESAHLDVTATDPALRATLKGLLMGALLAQGLFAGQTQARADLALRAGESLSESAPDRAHLAARVGIAEAQIAAAQTRNSAESSALALARNEMVGADGYETATSLQEAQTRLETLYTLTARLSRLNLADYL